MSHDPVLITGVGRRIGFFLTGYFLDRGFPVIGTYRTERPDLQALQRKGAELYQCDFNDELQLQQLIESIRQRHQRLRAIIHNASDWFNDDHSLYSPSKIIERMMQVHVSAPYQINLALEPLLLACQHSPADIIHIGDYVSSRGSKKHIAYAASKAAQDNLTFSFASKLAPGVKVNSIAPALVLFKEDDDLDYRDKAKLKSLMQREGGLEEIRRAIGYLFDSHYITGRILPIDGGRHLI